MADPQIPPQRPPAQFFNIMQVSHTPREFFFVLGQSHGSQVPDQGYVEVQMISHVVTTPQHAKAMLQVLKGSVEKYEQQFGEISEPGAPESPLAKH